ncbi:MAG: CRISPR-associated endonuclease Cas2 [Campylobacterales bacterium]
MYILIMFDLPTKTKKDRKKYTLFRKQMLDDGFTMLQYSVYMRICKSNYSANAHIKYIKRIIPLKGEVRILKLTDKVYNSMEILKSFEKTNEEKLYTQTVIEF